MKKRLFTMSLLLFIFPTLLCPSAFAASRNGYSNGLEWKLDDAGQLTITGSGKMQEFIYTFERTSSGSSKSWTTAPWLYEQYIDEIKNVIIEEGVTTVGSGAFRDCKNLISVSLPDSVINIGAYAFEDCENLTSINFPTKLHTIDVGAFDGCRSLTSISFPDGISRLGDGAFEDCSSLSSVEIPNSIVSIGEEVFEGCSNLRDAIVTDSSRKPVPAESNNLNHHDYHAWGYHAENTKSYLYQDENDLVRVECIGNRVIVERYSGDFQIKSARSIESNLADEWGGFFHGQKYNFVITGEKNPTESNSVSVIHIYKYDQQWNRLGECNLDGANTTIPFRAGSLQCAEQDGILYVHTCHQMYKSNDGLNHQANLSFALRQDDMEIADAQYMVSGSYGYVSHSFNQFIIVDSNKNIVTLDHGDAYPRAAVLHRYSDCKAGDGRISGATERAKVVSFPGETGQNSTGASLGGLVETSSGYITTYNYNGSGPDGASVRNVYLSYTSKRDFSDSATKTKQITFNTQDGNVYVGNPVLVPTSLHGGYVLWNVEDRNEHSSQISFISYDEDGNLTSVVQSPGALSDCQPILFNGKIVWYVTEGLSPVFYSLDSSGLSAHRTMPEFDDVSSDSWYYHDLQFVYLNGLMGSQGSTHTFEPDKNAMRGTIVNALYQLDGASENYSDAEFPDVSGVWMAPVSWAASHGIVNGYEDGRFGPERSVSRDQFATIMYRYAKYKGYDTSAQADLSGYTDCEQIGKYAIEAMRWANANGLINGTSQTTLSPKGTATRAQVAAILTRFYDSFVR